MPKDAKTRYFYWTSNDGSKVLTANIKNGYYAGVDLIEQDNFTELVDRISTETKSSVHLLPVGGDQRAVDFNLKERLQDYGEALTLYENIIKDVSVSKNKKKSILLP